MLSRCPLLSQRRAIPLSSPAPPALFLHRPERDPLDEFPLHREEQHHDGQNGQQGASHEHAVFLAVDSHQTGQAEGQGVFVGVPQHDHGPEKLVPGAEKPEDAQGPHGRFDGRNDDAPVDTEFGGSVYPGRVDEVRGHAEDELPHEEHAEPAGRQVGQDHALVGVQPAELVQQGEEGDQHQVERDHHRGEHDGEKYTAALERVLGEGEPAHGGDGQEQ